MHIHHFPHLITAFILGTPGDSTIATDSEGIPSKFGQYNPLYRGEVAVLLSTGRSSKTSP
jgi:hypothetical protein